MDRGISISGRVIDDESDCYVIAELGHNHQGDMQTALQLIREAAQSGADAVKLQKRHNRKLFTKAMFDSPYENRNSYGATYGEHREFLEFDAAQYRELMDCAASLGVALFATAFDPWSADFLAELGMPAFKIASGDLTNLPLLRHVADLGKPLVISTGGAAMDDVRRAFAAVSALNGEICLLQCTSGYPSEFHELNLRVIETFRREFPSAVVGLSAHDSGIAMPVVAYVLGARVVEKHFTLNRAMRGTDHAFSLEPVGLRKMVRDLRRARVAMGDGVKAPFESELKPLGKMSKKLVAARDLPAGQVLALADVAVKSPGGGGLAPYELDSVLGRTLLRPLAEDEALDWADLTDLNGLA